MAATQDNLSERYEHSLQGHIARGDSIRYEVRFFSTEMILFAQVLGNIIIDKIPLAEVLVVREMLNVDEEEDESNQSKTKKPSRMCKLMIETQLDGYNSGRTYYLQAETSAACRETVEILTRSSQAAYRRLNSQTLFKKAKARVGKVFRSFYFQNFMALLIIAVSMQHSRSLLYHDLAPRKGQVEKNGVSGGGGGVHRTSSSALSTRSTRRTTSWASKTS